MTCDRVTTDLDAYLDGELEPAANAALDEHVRKCAPCREHLARARKIKAALAALPVEGPRPEFFARALRNAAEAGARRERRTPRLIAAGLSGAIAASILTAVLVLHWTGSPETASSDVPAVSLMVNMPRTVNLLFASREPLDRVELTVDLPEGVELLGHEGQRRVAFRARLQAGDNLLPLELVAVDGRGGTLVARLRHDGKEKTFTVNVGIDLG
jgi:anti-sigma factor RsiW